MDKGTPPLIPSKKDPDQERALDLLINNDKCMILSGGGGTGKTYILSKFLDTAEERGDNVAVVAPTGVAASLHGDHGGMTIHSFFGFQITVTPELRGYKPAAKRQVVMRTLDVLVVDEVSMLRADLIDCMDAALRRVRNNMKPFGGVRVVFCGDLAQLPPVVPESERAVFSRDTGGQYASPYFIDATVFRRISDLDVAVLTRSHRQVDPEFARVVSGLRHGKPTEVEASLAVLNSRVDPNFTPPEGESWITLTGTRNEAAFINDTRIRQIASNGTLQTYEAVIKGINERARTKAQKNTTALETLTLAEGAHVMFVKNHEDGLWQNGTVGVVVEAYPYGVTVRIGTGENADTVFVEPETWKVYEAEVIEVKKVKRLVYREIASFTQIPLIPSWAITIHKAQGQSFDHMIVDLSRGAFADGQTYVAISRCTNLEGLVLTSPLTLLDVTAPPLLAAFDGFVQSRSPKIVTTVWDKDKGEFAAVLRQGPFLLGELNTEVGNGCSVQETDLSDLVKRFAAGCVLVGDPVPGLEDHYYKGDVDVRDFFTNIDAVGVMDRARAISIAYTSAPLSLGDEASLTYPEDDSDPRYSLHPFDDCHWNVFVSQGSTAKQWALSVRCLYGHLSDNETNFRNFCKNHGVPSEDIPSLT